MIRTLRSQQKRKVRATGGVTRQACGEHPSSINSIHHPIEENCHTIFAYGDFSRDLSIIHQNPGCLTLSTRVRQANTNYAGKYLCVVEWNTKSQPVQVATVLNTYQHHIFVMVIMVIMVIIIVITSNIIMWDTKSQPVQLLLLIL